jgi:hypothetical protein
MRKQQFSSLAEHLLLKFKAFPTRSSITSHRKRIKIISQNNKVIIIIIIIISSFQIPTKASWSSSSFSPFTCGSEQE